MNIRLSILIINIDTTDAEINHMEHNSYRVVYDIGIPVNCNNFGVGCSLNGCNEMSLYTRMPSVVLYQSWQSGVIF